MIVTEVGGLPEVMDDNGWIIPPENPAALAQAIDEALEDREQLQRKAQKSLELIRDRFAPARIAQQHIDLYSQLIHAQAQ